MKTSATKTPKTTSRTATQTASQPFFAKAGQGSFFAPAGVQMKMTVNKPGDKFEQEADKMADKVMRMASPPAAVKEDKLQKAEPEQKIQKAEPVEKLQKAEPEQKIQKKDDELKRKGGDSTSAPSSQIQSTIRNKTTGGQPLGSEVRSYMEPRFGADFSNIRVHTDPEAANLNNQLSARAFTYQNHVFFSRDQYQPGTGEGKHLLAHELTHTIQQGHAIQRSQQVTTTATPPPIQRLGVQDALDYFADKAYHIPGFRLLTILMGFNPINRQAVDRSAANILRAMIELIPGGHFITQALDNHGVFNKAGAWVEQKLAQLADIGSDIGSALSRFLDSLGWSDVLDLGGVWDRAKRIFTEPIKRILSFAKSVVVDILQLVKDAILRPLAALAQGTRGYDLLKALLGEDPITGEKVPRNADTLIGGFMKLIGQEEVWENLKKGNAVARAWAWFDGALKGLLGFARAIPRTIINTFRSLTFQDIITVAGAFSKIVGAFANIAGSFFSWAFNQVISLLEILFSVVAPGVMPYLKKAKAAFTTILKNPVGFVRNLVRAGKQGFQLFAGNILEHLKTALINWIVGPLAEAGVYIPKSFSLMEIIKLVLSVLGLTWQAIRAKLVKIIPEPVLAGLEKTASILVTLVKDGPVAAWEQIKTELGELKDQLVAQITQMISSEVVKAAVTKLASMLNPAGAVVQAILAVYNTISFFIQKAQQIGAVVASFVDSIAAIAAGQVAPAAKRVEQTMARTLTVVLAFLAKFAGLGGIPDKVVGIVRKIRQPIDKGMDKIVGWLGNMLKSMKTAASNTIKSLLNWWNAKKQFRDQDGEEHTVYFAGNNENSQLMVASTPKLAHQLLNEIASSNSGKTVIPIIKKKIKKIEKLKLEITSFSDEKDNKIRIKEIETLVNEIGDLFATISIKGKSNTMQKVQLTFERVYAGMDEEYNRQIKEQQSTIRDMTIAKWLSNRFIFENKGRIQDSTLRKQINIRNLARNQYIKNQMDKGLTKKEAQKLWEYQAAATHSLDQVAGGDHYVFSNVGVSSVNSHLGTQWKSKIQEITKAVSNVNPSVYGTVKMNVDLK